MADPNAHLEALQPGEVLSTCTTCGQAQIVPDVPPRMRACCVRCQSTLRRTSSAARSNSRTAALTLSALMLYPLGIGLPLVRIEKFGYATDDSILTGVIKLLGAGDWFVGGVVLICSIIVPLAKLGGLLALSAGGLSMHHHHRALTYHIVEWTGRWGMLDVLLVAVLVAAVKIGDLVEVTAGPAAIAFGGTVLLSLLAAASFNPHSLWADPEDNMTTEDETSDASATEPDA